jgi:hypothetical protein
MAIVPERKPAIQWFKGKSRVVTADAEALAAVTLMLKVWWDPWRKKGHGPIDLR